MKIRATSKTWTQTLDPDPGLWTPNPGPWTPDPGPGPWTLDPDPGPGPWTRTLDLDLGSWTWTLKNLDPEKHGEQLDMKK